MYETQKIGKFIKEVHNSWCETVIVIWGGNIYRWSKLISAWLNPTDSHSMSMLSTVFNAVTLKSALQKLNIKTVVMDALHVEFLEKYTSEKWKKYLREWSTIICSSWTGNPFFTTDTTWVLRALELDCEAIIKLTKVDGVYSKDPLKYDDAKHFAEISYNEFVAKNLQVFDMTGIILARDNKIPIYITKIGDIQSVKNILHGKSAGSKIF